MKNHVLTFLFLITISFNIFSQAVGYQGKKFIVEIGYSPASNLAARYAQYSLADDHYGNSDSIDFDVKDPLFFKHIPKLSIEYVIFNIGSVVLRYNPFNITSNIEYLTTYTDVSDLVAVRSAGNMFSLGYKTYTSSTPAPLGAYFALYGTIFTFNTKFQESEFAKGPLPEDFDNFSFEKVAITGISLCYGVKNIFWDKMTLDISLEAGYFFNNLSDYTFTDLDDFKENYFLAEYQNPIGNSVVNTRAFFFAVPTVSIGYLAF